MPWQSQAWKRFVDLAVWTRDEQRVFGPRLLCDVCRNEFIPGPFGAATFTDEAKFFRMTVCVICEARMLSHAARVLQERATAAQVASKQAIDASEHAIDDATAVLNASIDVKGELTLGPAPKPDAAPTPQAEADRA